MSGGIDVQYISWRESEFFPMSSDMIFTLIFRPFSTQLPLLSLSPPFFLWLPYYMFFSLCLISLTNRQQEHNSIGYYQSPTQQSTWLLTSRNSPVLLRPPDPALELLQPPSLAPTVQSSRLPGHRAWVGVRPPHEDLSWSQGSLSVPQQDCPDWLPPCDKLCPLILWGMCQT